jgi:hypothetical protein
VNHSCSRARTSRRRTWSRRSLGPVRPRKAASRTPPARA